MANASPLNRPAFGPSYEATIRPGVTFGSIADRPQRIIGRPMDAARRFERLSRISMREGDVVGSAQAMGMSERSDPWNFAPMGMGRRFPMDLPSNATGSMSPPMGPAAPAMPSGKLVPGRSGGSLVWQDTPTPMTPPTLDATSGQPVRSQPVPMGASPIQPAQPPTEEPVNPFLLDPLGNYVNPTAGMVPNGFGAMNEFNAANGLALPPPGLYGAEAAPMLSSAPIPGTDQMMPMVMGQPKGTPVARSQPKPQAEWQAPKMYDETIPEVRDGQGNVKSPARTRQYYFVPDPKTGKPMKEYALDANGDGVPDNQQPGWMNWLQGQK